MLSTVYDVHDVYNTCLFSAAVFVSVELYICMYLCDIDSRI